MTFVTGNYCNHPYGSGYQDPYAPQRIGPANTPVVDDKQAKLNRSVQLLANTLKESYGSNVKDPDTCGPRTEEDICRSNLLGISKYLANLWICMSLDGKPRSIQRLKSVYPLTAVSSMSGGAFYSRRIVTGTIGRCHNVNQPWAARSNFMRCQFV